MSEFIFEGSGRKLTVRKVTVGGWRVIEHNEYVFQFTSKAKATAYAKRLTGAKAKLKVDNQMLLWNEARG